MSRILVAGVGNIFASDDGFGPEAARRLLQLPLPAGVHVRDYGISGIHLAYDLLDACDVLIVLDAVPRGNQPGTIVVLEVSSPDVEAQESGPSSDQRGRGEARLDGHGMDPATVFATLERLGGSLPRTLVVGCEPARTGEGLGLSEPVERAVDTAVDIVRDLIPGELEAIVAAKESTLQGSGNRGNAT